MRFQALLGRLVDVLSFSAETYTSIFIGVVASFGIAYLIYRLLKKKPLHKEITTPVLTNSNFCTSRIPRKSDFFMT